MHTVPDCRRVLKAIMFTDIVDSTPTKTLVGGDLHYFKRMLFPHYELVRYKLKEHSGVEIKTTGDGFLLSFDTVNLAVEYAIELQNSMEALIGNLPASLRIRIGIHWGEVLIHESNAQLDITGSNVDYASRICDAANPMQVLLSGAAATKVELKEFHLTEWKGYVLKGFEGVHSLFQVTWGKVEAKRPEGKTRRICDKLLNILRLSSDPNRKNQSVITIKYRSRKLKETWVYQVMTNTKCGDLADALAEQHFAPFHSMFRWKITDDADRPYERELSLVQSDLQDNFTIGMMMESSDPIAIISGFGPEKIINSPIVLGDFDRAIREYEKIVKIKSDDINDLNSLAWSYLESNRNIKRAEKLIRRCVELDPSITKKAYFRDTMGWLEYRKKNYPAAEEHLLYALAGIDRLLDQYNYVCTLHHLYFVWHSLKKENMAVLARNELVAVPSLKGAIRLFIKRTEINDDSFLFPNASFLDTSKDIL